MDDGPQSETLILAGLTEELESVLTGERSGIGTDTASEHEGESNLIGNEDKTVNGSQCTVV